MGSNCTKASVEVNQVFDFSKEYPIRNYFEFPLSSTRKVNCKIQTDEEDLEIEKRYSQVSKFEFKTFMENDSEGEEKAVQGHLTRRRKKFLSTVYKSEIWDNMIKFQENKSFKIKKEHNKELNDSNLIIGAITEVPMFKKLIIEKSMW